MEQKWYSFQSIFFAQSFILTYVLGKEETPHQVFVEKMSKRLKNLTKEMIETNLAHITYIANYLQIKHHCDIVPLPDYSLHALFSFIDQADVFLLFPDRDLLDELIRERYEKKDQKKDLI